MWPLGGPGWRFAYRGGEDFGELSRAAARGGTGALNDFDFRLLCLRHTGSLRQPVALSPVPLCPSYSVVIRHGPQWGGMLLVLPDLWAFVAA